MTSLCAKLRHVTGWPSAKVHYQGQKRLAFTGQHKSQLNSTSHKLEKKISTIAFSLFIFNKFIYFLAALGLRCCARAFSSCGERGLLFMWCTSFSLQWLLLLWSTGSRRAGFSSCGSRASVVVAHGLSCSAACEIFPDQGSNPCPLHWQADS